MSERDTQALTGDAETTEETPPEDAGPSAGNEDPGDDLARLAAERDELYDRLLRKQAELENYRKRVVREKEELRVVVRSEIIRELLLVLDAGEKGLETLAQETSEDQLSIYRDGFELVVRQLKKLLERYGVHAVPGVGCEFDPRYHEAVAREATDEHPDGNIIDEFRRGYLLGEYLIRPSQVKVAVAGSEEPESGVDG